MHKELRPHTRAARPAFLAGLLLLAVGCTEQNPVAPEAADIYGAWGWVRSTDAAGSLLTPASTGYDDRYVFRTSDTLHVFRADTLFAIGHFFVLQSQAAGDLVEGVLYLPRPRYHPMTGAGPVPDPTPLRHAFTLSSSDTLRLLRSPLTSHITEIVLVRTD